MYIKDAVRAGHILYKGLLKSWPTEESSLITPLSVSTAESSVPLITMREIYCQNPYLGSFPRFE